MRTQNNPLQKVANIYHMFQSIYANIKYGFPYRKLKFIGITGTDGKTTTTSMIYHILKQNNKSAAYISTIKAEFGQKKIDIGLHVTTPDPWDVPKYLKMIADQKIEFTILESTSQGLEQNRLWGIKYDAVTITNIKSDHLDYHVSWENYAKSKYLLIKKTLPSGLVVLNSDDKQAAIWLKQQISNQKQQILWYSKNDIKNYNYSIDGLKFTYKGTEFEIPVLGEYNLENALAAINITNRYQKLSQIAKALRSFQPPKGRMEVIQKNPFTAIIDFAHTPHALEYALKALNPIKNAQSRIITIFGCAGKRDKKRREMGRVAAQLADIIILTSEDPRNEKLSSINDDIINYAQQAKGRLIKRFADTKDYQSYPLKSLHEIIIDTLKQGYKPIIAFDEMAVASRVNALDCAVKIANKTDIIFTTGKAHEESNCFGEKEFPYSEHKYLRKALKKNLN